MSVKGKACMLQFEWDPNKAKKNFETHGISFDEANTTFGDTLSLVIYDPLHSDKEDRFILIGNSHKDRILVVIHTEEVTISGLSAHGRQRR